MILVRDVFSLKFGKAKDVKALLKEMKDIAPKDSLINTRILFDLVGPAYTMVMESSFENLSAYESEMAGMMSTEEWRQWYMKFSTHMEKSYREIFTIFEGAK